MALIIGIDPSPVHTAIVVIDDGVPGHIFHAATYPIIEAGQWLVSTMAKYPNARVVIEKPPVTPRGASEESGQTVGAYWMLRWLVESFGSSVHNMAPGTWKPAAKGWKLEYPAALRDKHMRDAYAMLMVYQRGKGAVLEPLRAAGSRTRTPRGVSHRPQPKLAEDPSHSDAGDQEGAAGAA